ncbi:hypothetical protein ACIBI7_51710 [Nonomuraea fuscirosea]|uniref:hypothetical protein n=1 Tax=Nonomuraea fuscirosea TaxID=1291556 RepID=UPI0037985B11
MFPPQPYQSAFTIRSLPSSLPEAYFEASLDLTWTIDADSPNPNREEIYKAHQQLREMLQHVTRKFSVRLLEETQSEAEIVIYRRARSIDARLTSVQLKLWVDPKVKHHADELEQVLRDNAVAEAGFEMKARQARYVRDHLLADAQVARLWWLDGKADKLPELLKMDNKFEQVVGLIKTGMGPATTPGEALIIERIAQLIKDFLDPLDSHHREVLLSQLGQIFNGYERDDLTARLRGLNGHPADDD